MGVITILMEAFIKELFFKEFLMVLEGLLIPPEIIMKDRLSTAGQMGMDCMRIKTLVTRVNLKTTISMEKEPKKLKTRILKEYFNTIRRHKVFLNTQIQHIKVHLWMTHSTAKVNSLIPQEFMQDNLKTENNMDTVSLIGQMDQFIEAISKMGSEMDRDSILI